MYSKAILPLALILSLASCSPIFSKFPSNPTTLAKRLFTQDSSCSDEQFGVFAYEYSYGIGVARGVIDILNEDNFFFETFIPSDYADEETVALFRDGYLGPYADLSNDVDVTINIKCGNGAAEQCNDQGPNGEITFAYTDGESDPKTITLCDAWFDDAQSPPSVGATTTIGQAMCQEARDGNRDLDGFESKAFILLHEYLHLQYTLVGTWADFAYSARDCADLAENDPESAIVNADNWMLTVLGAFWSNACGFDIPIPE